MSSASDVFLPSRSRTVESTLTVDLERCPAVGAASEPKEIADGARDWGSDVAAAAGGGATVLGTAATEVSADRSTAVGPQVVVSRQEPPLVGEAGMPSWTFLVLTYQDPYTQSLVWPQEPDASKRYIGAEIEIRNDSDGPLAVSPSQIRLRDSEAQDFRSGGVVGSDPRLFDVNMLPGERVRGWVWYGIPESIQPAELVYFPAAPLLRVTVAAITEPGTPVAEAGGAGDG